MCLGRSAFISSKRSSSVISATTSSPDLPTLASLGVRSTAVDSYVCKSAASEVESEAGA